MNIVVCVKQVPDTSVPIELDTKAGSLDTRDLVYVVNSYDKLAAEEAVRIKERSGDGHVTLISMGPPSAEKGLRNCLALGADRAILLCDPDFDGSDSYATGVALAKAIATLEYNLVLCGARSSDSNAGFVGAVLAENLGLPLVSEVTCVEVFDSERMTVHKNLEKGNRAVIEVRLPALLTVEAGINEPRYASLPSIIAAQRKRVERFDLRALGLSPRDVGSGASRTKVLGLSLPKPRPKRLFTPDSNLSAAERMRQVMSGGITQKSGELLEGDPDDVASKLLQFLLEQGLVPGVPSGA